MRFRGSGKPGTCIKGKPSICDQSVPRVQHEPASTVFAQLTDFVVFKNPECFGRVVIAEYISGVENVPQFVASKAVKLGVVGIQFSS